ncbi:MAG: ribonuclease P protein component 4 [Hadesarchaea archaeon]|nr:ribonuclease P protein component 4 [Hadesarchaea archaeon]
MTQRRTHKPADEFKKIAAEQMEHLLRSAEETFKQRPELADRYVRLAWRLKTRYNLKLPPALRRKFCRKCLSFWKPGASCRVRVQSGCVIITCLRCGRVSRLPYKPKRKTSKRTGKC